jgi:hypothetical protein
MSVEDNRQRRLQTALKGLRRWRLIQVASIFPMLLCVAFMFYFREASELGIMAFFLILIVGVMFPEVKGDIAQIHVILREEHAEHRFELQQLLREELQNLLKAPDLQEGAEENPASPEKTSS